jgi:hypothetical protein
MLAGTTHYDTLHIDKSASSTEGTANEVVQLTTVVRKGYLKRAAESHPDKNKSHSSNATADFQAVNGRSQWTTTGSILLFSAAYETLIDPKRRQEYDEQLQRHHTLPNHSQHSQRHTDHRAHCITYAGGDGYERRMPPHHAYGTGHPRMMVPPALPLMLDMLNTIQAECIRRRTEVGPNPNSVDPSRFKCYIIGCRSIQYHCPANKPSIHCEPPALATCGSISVFNSEDRGGYCKDESLSERTFHSIYDLLLLAGLGMYILSEYQDASPDPLPT